MKQHSISLDAFLLGAELGTASKKLSEIAFGHVSWACFSILFAERNVSFRV